MTPEEKKQEQHLMHHDDSELERMRQSMEPFKGNWRRFFGQPIMPSVRDPATSAVWFYSLFGADR